MRARLLLTAIAAGAVIMPFAGGIGLQPVLAALQDNEAAPTPSASAPATSSATATQTQPTQSERPAQRRAPPSTGSAVADGLDGAGLLLPPPPVEYPDHARRDPAFAGRLEPAELGLGTDPWNGTSGAFLSTLMRRMDTPIASRWAHMGLRNLLIARASTPRHVHPVDWAAERAWLLLRMGEADAARMLVSDVDVDQFTPKMFQVGVQNALANADPAALCPLQGGLEELEPQVYRLVDAICAALAGEPEAARSQIDAARRRDRLNSIDISLAQKVIGVAGDTGRAVTVEWDPVEGLNAWRFGLATATGMLPPDRLVNAAPPQLRAWQAKAPLIAPQDRLASAEIATGLGVFSSQSLIDLHSLIYDATGPDELPQTEAWQLRIAYIGSDLSTRLGAMRQLWQAADGPLEREATRAMLGRAAALVQPDPELQADAVNLIASMLAAGLDRHAARWAQAIEQMDDEYADSAWAMLALGAPRQANVERDAGRISSFIDRDESRGKKRSALLVAGLAGLGYIDTNTANRLNSRHNLRIGRRTSWTRAIDEAGQRGQTGTVLVLTATGLQARSFEAIPSSHLFHAVAALERSGLGYAARMIAAEALART